MTLISRYHPHEKSSNRLSIEITNIRKNRDHPRPLRDRLIQNWAEVEEKVKPVMRHFFTEKHKTPNSWFATRLDYSRSVATSSIVGHILGLGDRHISNILIDDVTGEVIPIDLGIAFDQVRVASVVNWLTYLLTLVFQGKAAWRTRAGTIQADSGYGRRYGHVRHCWGIPTLCRRNFKSLA